MEEWRGDSDGQPASASDPASASASSHLASGDQKSGVRTGQKPASGCQKSGPHPWKNRVVIWFASWHRHRHRCKPASPLARLLFFFIIFFFFFFGFGGVVGGRFSQ